MKLVIVETPEKAERVSSILGKGYDVRATCGEVRRLALRELRMVAGGEFVERYETPCERKLVLAGLCKAAQQAESVIIATTPDRVGELLAWDVAECLPPRERGKVRRAVLGEMTPTAVLHAISAAGEIDMKAVDAARARRLIDHMVSRELTPLLTKWSLLPDGTPAPGLTEIAALRLLVAREERRRETDLRPCWAIEAQLEHQGVSFRATMDDETDIATSEEACGLIENLMEAETSWVVERAEHHEESDDPVFPFTTATLLDEAETLLSFSPKQAREAALALYEAGLVTYPFTTSVHVPSEARQAARDAAAKLVGEEHLASESAPGISQTKNSVGLEAIRPTDAFHLPGEVSAMTYGEHAAALYTLIWRRFLASSMKPARYIVTLLTIRPMWRGSAEQWEKEHTYPHPTPFIAWLSTSLDDGYRRVYPAQDEDAGRDLAVEFADIESGDALIFNQIESILKPARGLLRFTPADLSSVLTALRIGCPLSRTAAPEQLVALGWAAVEHGEILPTPRGEDALYLCLAHFEDAFNLKVIQQLDHDLDAVAEGRADRVRATAIFFFTKIAPALEEARRAAGELVDDDPFIETIRPEADKETA